MEVGIYKVDVHTRQLLYLLGFVWNGSYIFINRKIGIEIEISEDSYYYHMTEEAETSDIIFAIRHRGLLKNINSFINEKFLYEIRKAKISKILKS
jgi:hypothetical protein